MSESKFKKWITLLKENPVSPKLKRIAWISNFLAVAAFIMLNVVLWYFVSYKNYLLLDYVPVGIIIVPEILLLIAVIFPFLIKWGRKRTYISITISLVVAVALFITSIWGIAFNKQIKDFINSFDDAVTTISKNSKISTDDYNVFVLKKDNAKNLSEMKDYTFGIVNNYDVDDMHSVVLMCEEALKQPVKIKKFNDVAELADGLLDKKCQAIIVDDSLMRMIVEAGDTTDDDKDNGPYANFRKKLKVIKGFTVKNELAPMDDPGHITDRCFNVLLSGIDTGGDVTNKSQSDVNVILSINPNTNTIVGVSTPSDYYIPLSISGTEKDKLCYAGNYGIDVSMKTLSQWYGIDIDYYVRMNFTGFKDIIDEIGGIDIESDYAFETHGYKYKKGLNKDLNGDQALWFARERESLKKGDVSRSNNQMKVIEAVIEKTSTRSILNDYKDILKNISESFQTNMSIGTMKQLVKMQVSKGGEWKINLYSVNGHKGVETTFSIPSLKQHVLIPNNNTVKKAKRYFKENKFGKKIK
ncbi:MAG: LCP family protein [Eubacterium sp.]|nr:LCP family protein [Eubacterium sp.]